MHFNFQKHLFLATCYDVLYILLCFVIRRLMTGSQGGGGGEARPMTSVSGEIIMEIFLSTIISTPF